MGDRAHDNESHEYHAVPTIRRMSTESHRQAWQDMIARQLLGRGIRDKRVLDVMRTVPRHVFVPAHMRAKSYDDAPLAIGEGQTISQPYMVALMSEMLELKGSERVLEVGTGSGYQAAILGLLAREVVSIERHESLARKAQATLKLLGIMNVEVRVDDGTLGAPDRAPFDGIIVTAGGPHVPDSLVDQLAVGGRLICPVGPREGQRIVRVRRTEQGIIEEEGIRCAFVPLIGEEGW